MVSAMGLINIILIILKRFLKVSSFLFFALTLLSSQAFAGVTFVDSFDLSSQHSSNVGFAFSSDGTKMFVVEGAGKLKLKYLAIVLPL